MALTWTQRDWWIWMWMVLAILGWTLYLWR
jgi:hypothetical protein